MKALLDSMEAKMGPFLITLAVALFLHLTEMLWQQPDMHEPDVTSILFICSILMLLMHPTLTEPQIRSSILRRLGIVVYMLQCLFLQYIALTFPWISFNRLLIRAMPGDIMVPFSGRMLLSTALIIFATYRWRRRSSDVITDAINEVYLEILGNGGFFPYLDMFPLNSGMHLSKIARFFINNSYQHNNHPPIFNNDQNNYEDQRRMRLNDQADEQNHRCVRHDHHGTHRRCPSN